MHCILILLQKLGGAHPAHVAAVRALRNQPQSDRRFLRRHAPRVALPRPDFRRFRALAVRVVDARSRAVAAFDLEFHARDSGACHHVAIIAPAIAC